MVVLVGLALLPELSPKFLVYLGVFFLPFAISMSVVAGSILSETSKQLAAIDNAFSQFPKDLRLLYFGDPALPSYLHRAFEYYHIRNGGRNTMQFIGMDHSVVYKKGCFLTPGGSKFEIFNFDAKPWIPYFQEFDGALVIGNPSAASNEVVSTLTSNGFHVACSGVITLLLRTDHQ